MIARKAKKHPFVIGTIIIVGIFLSYFGIQLIRSIQTVGQLKILYQPLNINLNTEFNTTVATHTSKYCTIAFPETGLVVDGSLGCNYETDYFIPLQGSDVHQIVSRIDSVLRSTYPAYHGSSLTSKLTPTVYGGYQTWPELTSFQYNDKIQCNIYASYTPAAGPASSSEIDSGYTYNKNLTNNAVLVQTWCWGSLSKVYYPLEYQFYRD